MKVIFRAVPLNGDIKDVTVECAPNSAFNALKYVKEGRLAEVVDYGRVYVDGRQTTIRESHTIPITANMIITMVEDYKMVGQRIEI